MINLHISNTANTELLNIHHSLKSYKQDRRCTYKRYIEARSSNYCCCGKTLRILCSACVSVSLVIQHAIRMRHIIFTILRFAIPVVCLNYMVM